MSGWILFIIFVKLAIYQWYIVKIIDITKTNDRRYFRTCDSITLKINFRINADRSISYMVGLYVLPPAILAVSWIAASVKMVLQILL